MGEALLKTKKKAIVNESTLLQYRELTNQQELPKTRRLVSSTNLVVQWELGTNQDNGAKNIKFKWYLLIILKL